MRCCARCKTPGFGCANGACDCHSLLRLAQQRAGSTPQLEALIPDPKETTDGS